jgi:hypothetical protein
MTIQLQVISPITSLIKVDHHPRCINWVLGPLQEVLPRAERNAPAKKKFQSTRDEDFHYQEFTSP